MADDISVQLEGAVESLGRFRDSLEENNIRMGNSASIEAKINKLEAEKAAILEKGNKAESRRMKNLSSGMGKAAKSMGSLAMKLGVLGGVLTMFKGVLDILLKVDRHGAKLAKQMGATRAEVDGLLKSAMNVESSFTIWGSTLAEAVKTAGALAQEFGQISRVTQDMIAFTGKFSAAFAVGTEAGAQFVEHLTRANVNYKEFVNKVQSKAIVQGNNLGVIFRDLVKNAGMVELYMSRGTDSIIDMASTAASLGKSLESFDKMAQAWGDLESIGENIGKTAQLFGSEFEDGLGSLTDLYSMYQNFQDVELHAKVTEQLAKTMTMEKGILISKKTGLALTRAQVEQAAKLYGGDTEFMLRSIKYEKDFEKFQRIKSDDLKLFGKTRLELTKKEIDDAEKAGKDLKKVAAQKRQAAKDEFGALNDAARFVANNNALFEDGISLLDVTATKRAKLLELAEAEVAKRKEAAEKELDLEKILTSALGILGKIAAMVATVFEPFTTAISSIFTDAVLTTKVQPWLDDLSGRIKKIFSGEGEGAFDLKAIGDEIKSPTGSISSALDLLSQQVKTNFVSAFSLKDSQGQILSKSDTWGDIFQNIVDKHIKPVIESLVKWISTQMFGAMGDGFDEWQEGSLWDWVLPDSDKQNIRDEIETLQKNIADNVEPGFFGGPGWDEQMILKQKKKIADLQTQLGVTGTLGRTGGMTEEQAAIDIGAVGTDWDKYYKDRAIEQAEAARQAAAPDRGGAAPVAMQTAKGWSGAAHRAVVGEAGTEVGITKSALRELSSAGIPGHQDGYGGTIVGGMLRRREGLSQVPGGVGGRMDRHESSRGEQQRYTNTLNNFLRRQDDFLGRQEGITEKQHKIWMRDQKEFFVRYPAVIDQAFGEPFRRGGDVVEGIYNSVFSGMQASTRAELAGADKDTQRQLMYQHMTAEGMKPGGLIDQGMDWLGKQQEKNMYMLQGGLKIEQEELARLHGVNVEMKNELAAAKETENEVLNEAYKQNNDLKEVQARVDAAKQSADDAANRAFQLETHLAGRSSEALDEAVANNLAAEAALAIAESDLVVASRTAGSAATTADEASKSRKIAEENLQENRDQTESQRKIVREQEKAAEKGEAYHRISASLLGGIQSGLAAAAGVIARGGSKKEAKEMGKRGVVSGVLGNIAQQLGGGNQDFINQMNTMGVLFGTMPMPSNIGGNASDIINKAMSMTETTFQRQGRGRGWTGAAQGRVFTSPHLAMVGEGSQNEVVIPTERIRKGLPINAGVAKELGSIGVPGYQEGKESGGGGGFFDRFMTGQLVQQEGGTAKMASGARVGTTGGQSTGAGFAGRLGHSFAGGGGFAGIAATGILSAAQTYQQTGDLRASAAQGLGAGIGLGATLAISAIPGVGPFIGPILGPMIGAWAGGKLGKMFAKKPKYGRYRRRAIAALEEHVSTKGRFRWGQPEDVEENLIKAIAGKQKDKPSDKHYEKLKKDLQSSSILGSKLKGGNVDSFIGLLSGQIGSTGEANQMYKGFNNLFYGTPMAEGGIVTGPTSAIIGEKGPEAVIPLDRYGGYASQQQQQNSNDMVTELKKQNQQMQLFIKKIGDAKTVLNVDGRRLAEAVGENMYDINGGI